MLLLQCPPPRGRGRDSPTHWLDKSRESVCLNCSLFMRSRKSQAKSCLVGDFRSEVDEEEGSRRDQEEDEKGGRGRGGQKSRYCFVVQTRLQRMVRTAKRGKTFFSTFYAPAEPWGGLPWKKSFSIYVFNHPPLEGCIYVVCTYVQESRSRRSLNRSAALTPPPFSYSLCTWT